jgi:hypothetical protein
VSCIELTCSVGGFGINDVESLAVHWRALVSSDETVGLSTREVVNNTRR